MLHQFCFIEMKNLDLNRNWVLVLSVVLQLLVAPSVWAQKNTNLLIKSVFHGPKEFYFSWGYHRNWYSKSDLHFRKGLGNEFAGEADYINFTVYEAKAKDRPDFDGIKDVANITVPQCNARLGFTNKRTGWGLELIYDHAKYVVQDFQNVSVKGNIHGKQVDTFMQLDPHKFIHLEHTDGANYWMLNLTKQFTLIQINKNVKLSNMLKLGGGINLPRTDVSLFGKRNNNNFHIAGYVLGFENALRFNLGKYIYSELAAKYAFVYFTNAIVDKAAHTFVTHKYHSAMAFVNLGVSF